ncbi:hypothetical protein A5797_002054, partial [Enterococcus faecalis]
IVGVIFGLFSVCLLYTSLI